MRTRRKSHLNKINIVTLGCSKNRVDSENILGQLSANKIPVAHETAEKTGTVIINTCGFIESAKEESINTILKFVEEKSSGNIEKIYVTGCLSHRYKDDLKKEIPEVDGWFGTMELSSLLQQLGTDYKHDLVGERIITTPAHYAYLKISEGCDRPCSFCAIPAMRGRHVSRSIESLVREATHLTQLGVKELILIAQDSTYYGLDIYGERKLSNLLQQLSKVENLGWLRLHYAFPGQFPLDVLSVMAGTENICKYIDMPVQHASDKMLKLMRRGITKKQMEKLITMMREKIPGMAIRTTVMVGHPGETEEDIEILAGFMREIKFERLGIFKYSHEEGTHAFGFEDSIPETVKEERLQYLMEIQQEISASNNYHFVGKTIKVLVDRKEGQFYVGRTEYDSPEVDNEVLIGVEKEYIAPGQFVNVKIISAGDFDLVGEKV